MKRLVLLASSAGASLLVFGAAQAQQSPEAAGAATVEEVIVTAQKREQSLQDVPISVSAYTSDQRELIGIDTIYDVTKFTPGMSYSFATGNVTMRGIGRTTNGLGSDPGVSMYIDGVFMVATTVGFLPTWMIEQTEILRGPQGTLFGRNSIGGAVNVTFRKPTDSFQGEVRQSIGNYETTDTSLRVSGPISDSTRYLLGASFRHQGKGYIKNLAGRDEEVGDNPYLIARLEHDFTDNFTADLTYWTYWSNGGYSSGTLIDPYDTVDESSGLVPNPFYGYTTPNPSVADRRVTSLDDPGAISSPYAAKNVSIHANWDMDGMALKYIGSWNRYRADVTLDSDLGSRQGYTLPYTGVCIPAYCPYPNGVPVSSRSVIIVGQGVESFSNELNLTSTGDGPLQWIAGLFQYKEANDGPLYIGTPGQPELVGALGGTPGKPPGTYILIVPDLDTTSYAAFGQIDYEISDTLSASIGLRHTWDRKKAYERIQFALFNPNLLSSNAALDLGEQARNFSDSWHGWSGRAGLQWRPNPDTMLYATYSRGYKSGGFALGSFDAEPSVRPEYVNAYEIGAKLRPGRSVSLDASAFYYDYTDFQVTTQYDAGVAAGGPPSGVIRGRFQNAPGARSYGLEVEARWAPIPPLELMLAYGYLNAEYADFSNVIDPLDVVKTGPQDLKGNQMLQSPRNKLAVNGVYTVNLPNGALALSASYAWTDKQYASVFNTPFYRIPSHGEVDLRATYTDADDRYDLVAFVANATDEYSFNSVTSSSNAIFPGFNAGRVVQANPPRTYGVELRYRF